MDIKKLIKFQEKKVNEAYAHMYSLGYETWEELAEENKEEIYALSVEVVQMKNILTALKGYETFLNMEV